MNDEEESVPDSLYDVYEQIFEKLQTQSSLLELLINEALTDPWIANDKIKVMVVLNYARNVNRFNDKMRDAYIEYMKETNITDNLEIARTIEGAAVGILSAHKVLVDKITQFRLAERRDSLGSEQDHETKV